MRNTLWWEEIKENSNRICWYLRANNKSFGLISRYLNSLADDLFHAYVIDESHGIMPVEGSPTSSLEEAKELILSTCDPLLLLLLTPDDSATQT